MKVIVLIALLALAAAGHPGHDHDDHHKHRHHHLTEDEFDEKFHDIETDPEQKEKSAEALEKEEEEIDEIEKEFEEGKVHFHDELNEYSNIPKDEFEKEKTGFVNDTRSVVEPVDRSTGLILPENPPVDEESERIIDSLMLDRYTPSRFDARNMGILSKVKNQKNCGSCAAFSATSVVETCMKRAGGILTDLSPQAVLDCGYNGRTMNGCSGGDPGSYLNSVKSAGGEVSHESKVPYKNNQPNLYCTPDEKKPFHTGAKVSKVISSYNCNEEKLKAMVAQYGAVVGAMYASGPGFQSYKSGIYDKCPPGIPVNHAVVFVGYGTENGMDYWLVRNSWGPFWGDKGFVKIKRGVGMCSIGKVCAAVECQRSGRADSPPPPAPPKAKCDISRLYGSGINGEVNVNTRNGKVLIACENSNCSLVDGDENPCVSICGSPRC